MDPILGGAAIAGASGLIQSTVGALTAKKQQQRANQFNIDMWNRQNAYNTPAEQMRRFKEAGLNPNLIYGQGNSGNASNAPQFEQLAEQGYTPLDLGNSVSNFRSIYDLRMQNVQMDRLQAQIELDKQSAIVKNLEGISKAMENEKLSASLPYAKDMARLSFEALDASVKKTLADTQFTIDSNQRAKAMNDQSIMESMERIYASQTGRQLTAQQTKNLREEFNVKQLDSELARQGIRPNDPLYWRLVENMLETLSGKGGILPDMKKDGIWSWIKKMF